MLMIIAMLIGLVGQIADVEQMMVNYSDSVTFEIHTIECEDNLHDFRTDRLIDVIVASRGSNRRLCRRCFTGVAPDGDVARLQADLVRKATQRSLQAPAVATNSAFKVSVDYDDVRREGAERLSLIPVHEEQDGSLAIAMYVIAGFDGTTRAALVDDDRIIVVFTSASKKLEFLHHNRTTVLCDGRKTDLTLLRRDAYGHPDVRHVTESLSYVVNLSLLKRLGDGDDVRVAIGATSFPLTPDVRLAIREFCDRLSKSTAELRAGEAARARSQHEKGMADRERRVEEDEIRKKAKELADRRMQRQLARKDLDMARRFIKIKRYDTAREYLEKVIQEVSDEEARPC
jgi:hypothetical protein